MTYLYFEKLLSSYPAFSSGDLNIFLGDKYNRSVLNNLKRWNKKGYLVNLRKGVYLLNSYKVHDSAILAGKIYGPSYISLEYALGYYGIIPEMVFSVTSVTTRTTKEFHNEIGHYYYHKIKTSAFGGYAPIVKDGIPYYFANPEKALVDFLYLNRNRFDGSVGQFESYRFNEDFKWHKQLLLSYAKLFSNKKTTYLTNKFVNTYCKKRGE